MYKRGCQLTRPGSGGRRCKADAKHVDSHLKLNRLLFMKSIQVLLGVIPLAFVMGCSNPAKDVPKADVDAASQPATNAAAVTPEADAHYFAFGPTTAAIAFTGSKVTRSHNGGFKNFAGEFKVVNGRLADSGNKVVIDMTSLFADDARLTGHLKGPDFFGVAQNPTATFSTTAFEQKGTNTIVTGDLTMHGVTKSISFPAKIAIGDDGVKVTAVFVINRHDFDIKYPGMANDLIRKEVVLRLNVKSAPGRADFKALEQAAQVGAATAQAAPTAGGMRPRQAGR